ncbi:hypothetical protein GCM10023094_00500 [Rhodococcus olei]|uniref:Uncharacterized protein n=1 Tax=Rhodococcus olei TaxID=2161675 RepID=A0ABP8NQR6_9NOCA
MSHAAAVVFHGQSGMWSRLAYAPTLYRSATSSSSASPRNRLRPDRTVHPVRFLAPAPRTAESTGRKVHCENIISNDHSVTFVIEARDDTPAAEIDRLAEAEWDRRFATSGHAGRVRIPRPIAAIPHPNTERVVLHTYEGVMWDSPSPLPGDPTRAEPFTRGVRRRAETQAGLVTR